MANGKRGRPMTAVSAKLDKLLSDVAYIQAQADKDERLTVDQRTELTGKLYAVGLSINAAQSVFTVSSVVVDTGSDVVEPATPDTATGEPAIVENLNAVPAELLGGVGNAPVESVAQAA